MKQLNTQTATQNLKWEGDFINNNEQEFKGP